jgi:acyl-CoA reductase-like NAD-dependent aldehyde dehydrogenase
MPDKTAAPERLMVRKTYKLYIGGAMPRSESGRSYAVTTAAGDHLANAAQASRKDVRDAVVAARSAFPGWWGRTGYHRGQILYRAAEMMEGRREQFTAEVVDADGVSPAAARRLVDAAVDRWVYYAGWADKFAQVLGSVNPVDGPYDNRSTPEPAGVVGVLAPHRAPLLGLVSVVAPVIASGNTCVVLASERAPLPAVTLSEVLAACDLPGGVVNLLTGRTPELAPPLVSHADVDAVDLTGAADVSAEFAAALGQAAAETLTRVLPPPQGKPDWTADPGLSRLRAFIETKTVWHPVGR